MSFNYIKHIDLKFGYYCFLFITIVFNDKIIVNNKINYIYLIILLVLFIWSLTYLNKQYLK
jgi:hypothetical protein